MDEKDILIQKLVDRIVVLEGRVEQQATVIVEQGLPEDWSKVWGKERE